MGVSGNRTSDEILTIVLREMKAVGTAWRLDWSDFDGRTLRDQLDSLAAWAERAASTDVPEFTDYSDELREVRR